MPKRTDIKSVLLIGSGPIVIGQGCEFDYSGTQACKALKEEGYRVVLVNSNPATIMTDPEFADRTYIEPLTPEIVERIIEAERPDALLPTMGGQTALNLAMILSEQGVLKKYGVELIGAKYEAIRKAEHREEFKQAMARIGLTTPASGYATTRAEALRVAERVGFPCIIRPSFTLGGTGAGVAYNREEFERALAWALAASPTHETLIEASVLGWKEFELEVMRDRRDNVSIVCSIENLDPMGIHTGDSITVAPAQTLTDREYQRMRDAAVRIMREIGVDTGGSNIQFATHPETGEMHVIEMNPRVSRSSALASKATGYPIAKIATKLAVGYTLDEIWNDMTRVTPASFEPTIDYVVVKIPRFAFEKFPQADPVLTTQMKSVGEVMAIGRTFKEALQKAIRSLEIDSDGFESRTTDPDAIRGLLTTPTEARLWAIADAVRADIPIDEIHALTRIDPWFLYQIREIVEMEAVISTTGLALSSEVLRQAKAMGFADRRLAVLLGTTEDAMRERRLAEPSAGGPGVRAVFKRVDTCGAEFEAQTSYLYSTYEFEDEARPTTRKKVIILGSGPNRIGQGIEFDYCCVHAVFALKDEGYETIMVNCNPETVSTDYDTADRLYFEPLTKEDVLNIIETERPDGVVVQFGGQTPLKLAIPLEAAGVTILGTSPDAIDQAEDRERFRALIEALGLRQPASGMARTAEEAVAVAGRLTYPVMVRPSYVLGGRAMEIVYDEASLRTYIAGAVRVSSGHPILIDKYLEDAIEVDVDAVADGHEVLIGGILEHIEEAGVHSGDASMSLPPHSLGEETLDAMAAQTATLARALNVVGLMNIQFAVRHGEVYVLEVNPRASRTVPFVSKTTGVPLAKMAMKVMLGRRLRDLGLSAGRPGGIIMQGPTPHIAIKESVFPFNKFRGVDTLLGPEMKSTGEVMGLGDDFGLAFAKSQTAAYGPLPTTGRVFISVKDKDKPAILPIARRLVGLGFALVATRGTADFLRVSGVPVEQVNKVQEGRPHGVDRMKNREIHLVINTVGDKHAQQDSYTLRRTALEENLPYFTTVAAAGAVVCGLEAMRRSGLRVKALQVYHREMAGGQGGVTR